jgi:hypothetical protein
MLSMRCWIAALLFFPVLALAGEIRPRPPEKPDADVRYVFYLHGRIIETEGPRPTSADYGVYDYAAVLEALSGKGRVVVSSQRPPDTDVRDYAGAVVGQIERLVEAGVAEKNITVVGFSKGGIIGLYVSSFLRRSDVRFVILAGCEKDIPAASNVRLTGRVLSIVETSDSLTGPCRDLAKRAPMPTHFEELDISTGKGHGAFYLPRPEWVEPTVRWILQGGG